MNAAPGFCERAALLEKLYADKPVLRTLNFHNTSRQRSAQYDGELAHCSRFFSSVNEEELDAYVTTGSWNKSKPGLLVAAYEGYRNNYDVLAPLLEKHGFIGWFFIITDFVNAPVEDQLSFARSHRIWMRVKDYTDGRYALTWDELRELDRKHVVASHTRSHLQVALLDPAAAEGQILGAQQDFEKQLGHRVRAFASLKGVASGDYSHIDRLVCEAGHDFVFSSFRIQRVKNGFS